MIIDINIHNKHDNAIFAGAHTASYNMLTTAPLPLISFLCVYNVIPEQIV
jgi:hypothetical protein